MATNYNIKFILCEPGGGGAEIVGLEKASNLTYSADLLEGSTASFSIPSEDFEYQMITPGYSDIKVIDNTGEVVDRLRITSSNLTGGEVSYCTFQAIGYKQMLDTKKIHATDDYATIGIAPNTDLTLVAWELIQFAQGREGSEDFGIRILAGDSNRTTPSNVRYLDPGMTIRQAIDELGQTSKLEEDGSWDWDILAVGDELYFMCWAGGRGKQVAEYSFDSAKNITGFSQQYDYTNFANYITVQGAAGADSAYILNGGNSTSGKFRLTFNGYTTGEYHYSVSIATLTQWLEDLPSVGEGNVEVQGPDTLNAAPYKYTITFKGRLARRALPDLSITDGTMSGGTGVSLLKIKEGFRYSKTMFASGASGGKEYYHFDESLADSEAVDEKCIFFFKTKSNYKPSISVDVIANEFGGPNKFWLGDVVTVSVRDTGFDIQRSDLRVASINLAQGNDGELTTSAIIESPVPIDRTEANLGRRVAARELAEKKRLEELERQKRAAIEKLEAQLRSIDYADKQLLHSKTKLEGIYKSGGDKKIDAKEQRNVDVYTNKMAANAKLRESVQTQLNTLRS